MKQFVTIVLLSITLTIVASKFAFFANERAHMNVEFPKHPSQEYFIIYSINVMLCLVIEWIRLSEMFTSDKKRG